ncbi:MAG TPA: hypothetical protein PLO78_07030 [Candidatus Omnitrophota bacterium]|nr:hypothetical protein [Candidatus Omnitrophota bacterium]
MEMRIKEFFKKIFFFIVFIVILSVLSLGFNFWVYTEIQKRMKVRMMGTYVPALLTPSFELRNGNFVWESKFQLVKGDLKVTFDPLTMITHRGIRIIVTNRGAKIRFLGDWALQEGIEDAVVDSLNADILLGRHGLSGINDIEVQSQSFQFSLKNADKKVSKKP